MYNVRKVAEDLYWVGANDHRLALFENIHPIPRGVSYNAYVLTDEKTVLFDTVDWSACRQLLENLDHVLAGRPLDYLVIHHMEPDHGASVQEILLRYPGVKVVSSAKAFTMMRQFGFSTEGHECVEVKDGWTNKDLASKLIENGLLVLTAGPGLRLLPPLVISKEEMDAGLAIMEKTLR